MSPKLVPLLVATLFAVAGCATEADQAQVDAGAAVALVRGAPDAAAEITTARFELTVRFDGGGETLDMVSSGAVDRPGGRLAVDLDLSGLLGAAGLPGSDEPMQVVVDGTDLYLRVPLLEALADTSGWLALDASDLESFDAAGLFGVGAADPTSTLEVLRGASDDLEVIGTEPVRGVPATHYRSTVDVADALAASPEVARLLDGDTPGVGPATVDVWLDDDGLVRRLVVSIQPPAGDDPPVTASFTIELFDYGQAVDIEVPAAADVTPAEDLLGSLRDVFLGAGA